jgi:hypothetical protein
MCTPPPLLTSAPLKSLEGQYTHELNPSIGYPPPGNAEHMFAAPDPSHEEHYMPPARVPVFLICISCLWCV